MSIAIFFHCLNYTCLMIHGNYTGSVMIIMAHGDKSKYSVFGTYIYIVCVAANIGSIQRSTEKKVDRRNFHVYCCRCLHNTKQLDKYCEFLYMWVICEFLYIYLSHILSTMSHEHSTRRRKKRVITTYNGHNNYRHCLAVLLDN